MNPWLIVGLGNPGPKYAAHRHNIGAMALAALATDSGAALTPATSGALTATVRIGTATGGAPGPAAVLAAPQTFMNLSGKPVSALAKYYSVPLERIVVLHDELDIDFGSIRLKHGGGEGGHNGLRSISASLGSKDYLRVRLGIGRPPGRQDAAGYVLSNFPARDSEEVALLIRDAADAATDLVHTTLAAAQQRFHSR